MKLINRTVTSMSLATALLFPFALVAPAAVAPAAPVAAKDAKACVVIDGAEIVNACTFTIEIMWCVEGRDCRDGQYSSQRTFRVLNRYPHFGGDAYVRYGACRGANSIHQNDETDYKYNCDDYDDAAY